jgi:hypothetical protein
MIMANTRSYGLYLMACAMPKDYRMYCNVSRGVLPISTHAEPMTWC